MKQTTSSISVFFPCYNDSQSIGKLIDDAHEVLSSLTNNFEIIVIDDGSKDNSRDILKEYAKKYKTLKLIFHPKNKGYGGALKSGFKTAKKDLVFYTDGDGQYDVKELSVLLPLMTDDINFVNGIKMGRGDEEYRVFWGNIHKFFTRAVFWLPIYDTDCDFRLIRRSLLDKFTLESNSGSICVELVKRAQQNGGSFRQVSVHHYDRKFGSSQFFRLDRILKTYWEMGILWLKVMI
jgi:glycosyltransferase involved in cell wall biosynthesis